MENQEMKQKFVEDYSSMEDAIEILKRVGNLELVEIFERSSNIVNIAILNFSNLSEEDITRINSLTSLCDKLINYAELEGTLANISSVNSLLDSIEKDFVTKKFILDETPKVI